MRRQWNVLGIDIGSVAISVVAVNRNGEIAQTAYEFHRGGIETTLQRILKTFGLERTWGVAATSSTPQNVKTTARYDTRVAVMTAARRFYGKMGSV